MIFYHILYHYIFFRFFKNLIFLKISVKQLIFVNCKITLSHINKLGINCFLFFHRSIISKIIVRTRYFEKY